MPDGEDILPTTLLGNTLYIAESGNYILTRPAGIDFEGNCITLLGLGKVSIYSTGYIGDTMIINSKEYDTIRNISIDGISDGSGGTHTSNDNGIHITNASGNTIDQARVFNYRHNTNSMGIFLDSNSDNNSITNSEVFNNYNGIASRPGNYSDNNLVQDTQVYNNPQFGIIFQAGMGNTVNNVQSYNNGYGIYFHIGEQNATINNSQIYNNANEGIYTYNANNVLVNNSQSYNNRDAGLYVASNSSGIKINNSSFFNNG